ncbi:hypothetical protein QWZ14_23045 [Paeniroseomonas aquatica]|uniref:Uncharacterized protein n=1 Tax=Paeniroseomonas aquatica TaxID=373043 RepID=A0ABT8ACI2_9PROT|nr:hypothetical protein [Paeniroseomonas aquatica]MDN3567266.1 hypothetical protein [Paeniroseomonas aquatica]
MKAGGLLLALALAGCAELRQAPPAGPPVDLVQAGQGRGDQGRDAITAAAAAFADRGRGLAGQPEAAARAVAQLEFATEELRRNPRFAPIPDGVRREMLLARTEARDALGIAEAAPSEQVVGALLAAARALPAGMAAAAARARPAPLFRPGGERSVARLAEIGPLPQASIATALLGRQLERLDAESSWVGALPDETGGSRITTFGLGGNQGLGY